MTDSPAEPTRRRAFWRVRTLMLAALGAGILLFLALSRVGGSYALWQDSVPVDAGTITTGTAGLTAAWGSQHDDAMWRNLLPGESVRQTATLVNTGTAPLELYAGASTGSPGFEVRVVAGNCPGSALPVAAIGSTPRSITTAATPDIGVVLAGEQSLAACVEVRATTAATPDQRVAFALQIDGVQVPR
ncbi:hypothetical protein ACQ143_10430 [Microbacterium sp. MC2]